jgi:RNA 2',3'-cyclic 3'-phosphodiesterase
MPEQLQLAGIEAPQKRMERLFFAVQPDAATAAGIGELARRLCREHGFRGRCLATERLHITLHFLGDHAEVPAALIRRAAGAAAAVTLPPFEVALDHVVSFPSRPGHHPLVLVGTEGVAELIGLYEKLGTALVRHVSLPIVDKRYFTPHLTLLYGDRIITPQAIHPVRFRVQELVLIRSLVGRSVYLREAALVLRA